MPTRLALATIGVGATAAFYSNSHGIMHTFTMVLLAVIAVGGISGSLAPDPRPRWAAWRVQRSLKPWRTTHVAHGEAVRLMVNIPASHWDLPIRCEAQIGLVLYQGVVQGSEGQRSVFYPDNFVSDERERPGLGDVKVRWFVGAIEMATDRFTFGP